MQTMTPKSSTLQVVGTAILSERPELLAAFYERVFGLALEHRSHDDGREHWVAGIGDVHFEVKALLQADGSPTPDAVAGSAGVSNVELSLRVDDVAATVSIAVDAGATVHRPCDLLPWGTFAVVLDPDGNRLGLWAPPPINPSEGDAS